MAAARQRCRVGRHTSIPGGKMKKLLTFSLLLLLAVPSLLDAQISTRNRTQVGISGFGSVGSSSSSLATVVSLTQFFTRSLELGGDVVLTATAIHGETETQTDFNGFLFGRVNYNFVGQSLFVPYLSLGVGTILTSSEYGPTGMPVQVGAGFKQFLNERASLNGEVMSRGLYNEGEWLWGEDVDFRVGLSIYF
jgi:hypothetical protein